MLNYNSSESDSEFLLTSVPKLNTSSEETDELHSIAHEDYLCKVKPSEFDLSLDSVNSIEISSHNNNNNDNEIDKMDRDIITDKYLSEDNVNDDPVVNAVYICSKPAIIVAVASINEDTSKNDNEVNKNETEIDDNELSGKKEIDKNAELLDVDDLKDSSFDIEHPNEAVNSFKGSQEITDEKESISETKVLAQAKQIASYIEFEELKSDSSLLQPSSLEENKNQEKLKNINTNDNSSSDTNQFTNKIYEQILEEKSNNVLFTTEEDNKSSSDKSEVRDIPGNFNTNKVF